MIPSRKLWKDVTYMKSCTSHVLNCFVETVPSAHPLRNAWCSDAFNHNPLCSVKTEVRVSVSSADMLYVFGYSQRFQLWKLLQWWRMFLEERSVLERIKVTDITDGLMKNKNENERATVEKIRSWPIHVTWNSSLCSFIRISLTPYHHYDDLTIWQVIGRSVILCSIGNTIIM